jgi:hypothetical protein
MKTIVSVLFSFLCVGSVAQTAEDYYVPAKQKVLPKDRVSVSLMAGTSVSFLNGSKTAAFSTFIAPKLNYKISSKLSLNMGLMHYTITPNSSFTLNRNESFVNTGNRNSSGNLLFGGAEYKLNKRLIVSGAVMVDANGMKSWQNSYKAASVGMDYKLSEHSSIGFRATVSQGSSDYMFDQTRNSYQYRPFNNNSFGNMFSSFGQWGTEELNRTVR